MTRTTRTYELVVEEQRTGIKCLVCGLVSWHPMDVLMLYCGKCHRWHLCCC